MLTANNFCYILKILKENNIFMQLELYGLLIAIVKQILKRGSNNYSSLVFAKLWPQSCTLKKMIYNPFVLVNQKNR